MAVEAYQDNRMPSPKHDHDDGDSMMISQTPTPDINRKDVSESIEEKSFLRMETPADTAFARTKREEDIILRCIHQAQAAGSSSVDLSRKHLMAIPDELTQMAEVEYLYLEGNEITFLPDDFFKSFPKLKWLDLRNNQITRIPSIFLGSHNCLRNLLLENNCLKSLPLELGRVKTLHGLNITNNPLQFPPQDILEKGTIEIQKFLQEMWQAKSRAEMNCIKNDLALDCIFEDSGNSTSSDDWNTGASMMELAHQQQRKKSSSASKSKLISSLPSSEMYQSVGTSRQKQMPTNWPMKAQTLNGAGTGLTESHGKISSIMSWKVNPYPEPPSQNYIAFKMAEERQLEKEREIKQRTDVILQRRRDESVLKGWRNDAKKLQTKKAFQTFIKGTKDYPETAEEAPFAVDKPFMKMVNNKDRFKDMKEKPRRALSPASRARIEEEKAAKIRELEQRIKDHTAQMMERRRKPRGTPQEEMEAAKQELEIAEQLHRQLQNRQKKMEYRLQDFEAEIQKQLPVGTRLKH